MSPCDTGNVHIAYVAAGLVRLVCLPPPHSLCLSLSRARSPSLHPSIPFEQVLRLAEAHIKHEKEELKSLQVVLDRNKQDSDQRYMALEGNHTKRAL